MSDIKLFQVSEGSVKELAAKSVTVEKSLQELMEKHLEAFLGVRFLASEYSTGKTHGGRIDTLGIDENGCPVIIEYKRSLNENVINQGLYYLDWLLDHKGEFELLVQDFRPNSGAILIYVKVDPDEVELEKGFTRDVRHIGHFGTGDLEITVRSDADLEKAKQLLLLSYQAS